MIVGDNGTMRRRRRLNDATPGNATLTMNLSLFIMLLAFFIVINSRSSFEDEKKEATIESIERTFSTKVMRQDVAPSIAEDPYQSIREGDTSERIEALFRSQIASFKITSNDRTGKFVTEMPLDQFSSAVLSLGQKDLMRIKSADVQGRFFLPTLVSIMKSDKAGVSYRMDMMVMLDGNPAKIVNEKPQEISAIMKRGGGWAAKLEQAGLDPKLISYGVKKGRQGYIELSFHPHVPFSPVQEGGR